MKQPVPSHPPLTGAAPRRPACPAPQPSPGRWLSSHRLKLRCAGAGLDLGSNQGSDSRPNLYMVPSEYRKQDTQHLDSSFSNPRYILPISPVFFHHFGWFWHELG